MDYMIWILNQMISNNICYVISFCRETVYSRNVSIQVTGGDLYAGDFQSKKTVFMLYGGA